MAQLCRGHLRSWPRNVASRCNHEHRALRRARTIIDTFRLRGRLGEDLAYDALRRWLRRGAQPVELLGMARSFPRALPAIRHALNVLV